MRQLGRQAGSALTQTRIVPAPDDLRLELIGVPPGADVPLEVRFEAVSEGVLATGTAIAPLAGECARCLAPLTSSVTVRFQELFLYGDGRHDRHDKHDRYEKHDEQEEQDDGVEEGERASGESPVILNATLARRLFGDENPIGQQIWSDQLQQIEWMEGTLRCQGIIVVGAH
jgi:hypothetical protein